MPVCSMQRAARMPLNAALMMVIVWGMSGCLTSTADAVWTDLNLSEEHIPYFFHNHPEERDKCSQDDTCPYKVMELEVALCKLIFRLDFGVVCGNVLAFCYLWLQVSFVFYSDCVLVCYSLQCGHLFYMCETSVGYCKDRNYWALKPEIPKVFSCKLEVGHEKKKKY